VKLPEEIDPFESGNKKKEDGSKPKPPPPKGKGKKGK